MSKSNMIINGIEHYWSRTNAKYLPVQEPYIYLNCTIQAICEKHKALEDRVQKLEEKRKLNI